MNLNDLVIQVDDQIKACQHGVRIKQFGMRTNSISGFFNLVFTIAYGFGFDKLRVKYLSFLPPQQNKQISESGNALL